MDYKNYYLNQAGNGLPAFQGASFQKGYGLGGVFRRFFRWVMPILNKHALPVVKTVGEEIVKSASNIALDTINGKKIKDSFNKRINESMDNLSEKAGVISGEGYKKKRNLMKSVTFKKKLKKYRDIFSKKK